MSDQMQLIGYANNSSLMNLGSLAVIIPLFLVKVMVYYILKLISALTGKELLAEEKPYKKHFDREFFLSTCIYAYLEFLISGLLNY